MDIKIDLFQTLTPPSEYKNGKLLMPLRNVKIPKIRKVLPHGVGQIKVLESDLTTNNFDQSSDPYLSTRRI